MKTPFSVTLNLNNEPGVCAGATSWPFYPSVEATNRSLSFHLTDVTLATRTDQRTAGNGRFYFLYRLLNLWLVKFVCYDIFYTDCWYSPSDWLIFIAYELLRWLLVPWTTRFIFIWFTEQTDNKHKWFHLLPFTFLSSSFLPQTLSLLLFHPLVSTSQAACFFTPSSFFSPLSSHHTHLFSSLSYSRLLSVWHQRTGTLEGVVVWRGQLTPPKPLQSTCITAKHNGEPCKWHQYVARGGVVTPQTDWSSSSYIRFRATTN